MSILKHATSTAEFPIPLKVKAADLMFENIFFKMMMVTIPVTFTMQAMKK